MVNAAQSQFWRSLNLVMVNFRHSYALVKNQLFKQYWPNIAVHIRVPIYGICMLMEISEKGIKISMGCA